MALILLILIFVCFVVWLNTTKQGKRIIQRLEDKTARDKSKRKAEWQQFKDDARRDFEPIKEEWELQKKQDIKGLRRTVSVIRKFGKED
ncbi:hypothetical protein I6I87_07625 [Moraxella osloensis]|nr:hypothetical protein [Moraxella osloensis]QQU05974.1 hypothetical protein I6I87_07625 [Moraxella osloensis]